MGGSESQAENACSVKVRLEKNWRGCQNLLALQKIKVLGYVSVKHILRVIQVFCVILRAAGWVTQPHGVI